MGYSEKDINTFVKKSLGEGGFGFKIADPPKATAMTASKNPFDGFGVLQASNVLDLRVRPKDDFVPLYWESKFLSEMSAFSLKRIEEHQAYYLDQSMLLGNSFSVVPLGVYAKRGEVRVYLFHWASLAPLYRKGFSFHKKYLELLPYNQVTLKTGTFKIEHVIIREDIERVYGAGIYEEEQDAKGQL